MNKFLHMCNPLMTKQYRPGNFTIQNHEEKLSIQSSISLIIVHKEQNGI